MKSKLVKFWHVIPLMSFLLCDIAAALIQRLMHLKIRSVPWQILFWGTILSAFVFATRIALAGVKKSGKMFLMVPMICILVLFCKIAFLYSVFICNSEYIVERNGIKMVAQVESFINTGVCYYEYRDILFCGRKCIGSEFYGSGGFDPFKLGSDPMTWWFEDLEGNLIEAR